MKYGYFDDPNSEYVITRPDTPRSWTNYLGSKTFGSIISYCIFRTIHQNGFQFHSHGSGRKILLYKR